MPARRRPYGRRGTKSRQTLKKRSSARTIQQAWRRRKRNKFGLNTRTTLANRTAIRTLKKQREVGYLMTVNANSANGYKGQYMRGVSVDSSGQDSNGTNVVLKPCRGLIEGNDEHTRRGNKVIHKRTTFKFLVEAPTAALAPIVEEYNEVTVLICLDRAPNTTTAAQLLGVTSGSLLEGQSTNPMNKYYLGKNIGKTNRFKPLYRKTIRIAPVQGTVGTGLQSTGYPPFARWSHTIKAPYKLEYGDGPDLSLYPQNQELICFFFSDSSAVPHPTCSCFCKFTWVDP